MPQVGETTYIRFKENGDEHRQSASNAPYVFNKGGNLGSLKIMEEGVLKRINEDTNVPRMSRIGTAPVSSIIKELSSVYESRKTSEYHSQSTWNDSNIHGNESSNVFSDAENRRITIESALKRARESAGSKYLSSLIGDEDQRARRSTYVSGQEGVSRKELSVLSYRTSTTKNSVFTNQGQGRDKRSTMMNFMGSQNLTQSIISRAASELHRRMTFDLKLNTPPSEEGVEDEEDILDRDDYIIPAGHTEKSVEETVIPDIGPIKTSGSFSLELPEYTKEDPLAESYSDEVAIIKLKKIPPPSLNNVLFLSEVINEDSSFDFAKRHRIVLVTHPDVPKEVIYKLKESCAVRFINRNDSRKEVIKKVNDVAGIFLTGNYFKLDKEFFKEHYINDLKVVASMNHTFDKMDVMELKKRNIRIGIAREVTDESIAELALGLAVAVTYNFMDIIIDRELMNIKENITTDRQMQELRGSTCGIVGNGKVVNNMTNKLKKFKVLEILQSNPELIEKKKKNSIDYTKTTLIRKVDFKELLKKSDFIFVLCRLVPATHFLFNKNTFLRMKKNAVLIDVSVQGVVKSADLTEALLNYHIMGAGIDVTYPEYLNSEHPLLHLKNCIVTPRIATAAKETQLKMAHLTADNILAVLDNSKMPCEVCFKDVFWKEKPSLRSSNVKVPDRINATMFHENTGELANVEEEKQSQRGF